MPKPKAKGEVKKNAVLDGAMLMAASGFLETALADLDFLTWTKARLLASHPGDAEAFYRDAVAGSRALRELVGVAADWEYFAWDKIPPPPSPSTVDGKIDG